MSKIIATVFGVGHLRPAPGTWGSFAALVLAYAIYQLGGFWVFAAATIAVIPLGYWATQAMTADMPDHDPSEIVIDEVAGQWIALMPVLYGAHFVDSPALDLWPGWVTAFIGFRLFDITKPWLVGRADRRNTAWGVMLDDIWAGVFTASIVIFFAIIAHGIMFLN